MRITDDRYSRDRLRLDLALRFIRHEARTHTIRAWTGLTEDRIRKLYRSYLVHGQGERVARHRGRSPRQPAFFIRTPRMQQESAVLASVCCLFGVMPCRLHPDPLRTLPSVARGEMLCQAFEAYASLLPTARISFEHAVFLVFAIASGDDLSLRSCSHCGGLMVTDKLALAPPCCFACSDALRSQRGLPTRDASRATAAAAPRPPSRPPPA